MKNSTKNNQIELALVDLKKQKFLNILIITEKYQVIQSTLYKY